MSAFSHNVRECIRSAVTDHDRRFACLYGMLLFGKAVHRDEICLKSESEVFSTLFPELMHAVFPDVPLRTESRPRRDGGCLRIYRITGESYVTSIRRAFHIHEERHIDMRNLPTNSIGIFLGGVFLTCGSITDPAKEYHLEFNAPTEALCRELCDILLSVGVHPNVTQRRYAYAVYLKMSEEIGDLLTFMGAQRCTLALIDIQIDKEVSNRVNRMNNCDMANIDKVISASERQCRDIRELMRCGRFDTLSPELRELAELRLENPHLSLQELAELLEKPIGRSGVNHRFRRIAEAAAACRKEGDHASS